MDRKATENTIADRLCGLDNAEINAVFAFADAQKNGATIKEACDSMNALLIASGREPIPYIHIEALFG